MADLEYKVSRDHNLLKDEPLARVKYRREGERKWQTFVVVLDEETTYETVEENAESLIALVLARG